MMSKTFSNCDVYSVLTSNSPVKATLSNLQFFCFNCPLPVSPWDHSFPVFVPINDQFLHRFPLFIIITWPCPLSEWQTVEKSRKNSSSIFKMAWTEEFVIVLQESDMHFGKSAVLICLLIMRFKQGQGPRGTLFFSREMSVKQTFLMRTPRALLWF